MICAIGLELIEHDSECGETCSVCAELTWCHPVWPLEDVGSSHKRCGMEGRPQ
jgi:hypothetical protein